MMFTPEQIDRDIRGSPVMNFAYYFCMDFAHIDSDLYESAKCVLDNLKPRLKPGSILAFDEIWAHSNYQDYEAKAFAEFLNDTGFHYHCIGHFSPDKAGFKLLR